MKARFEVNGMESSYPGDISNLEELLLFMINNKISREEIVVEVKVNGDTYSEDFQHQSKDVDLVGVEKVEVFTRLSDSFAKDFLEQAPRYVAFIEDALKVTAELLRDRDKEGDGHDMLRRSMESLNSFRIHLSTVINVLGDAYVPDLFDEYQERLSTVLDRICDAQERGEPAVIADLLDRELLYILEEWEQRFGDEGSERSHQVAAG